MSVQILTVTTSRENTTSMFLSLKSAVRNVDPVLLTLINIKSEVMNLNGVVNKG